MMLPIHFTSFEENTCQYTWALYFTENKGELEPWVDCVFWNADILISLQSEDSEYSLVQK